MLLGLITGDGHFTNRGKGQQAAVINLWGEDREYAQELATYINTMIAGWAHTPRHYTVSDGRRAGAQPGDDTLGAAGAHAV